MILFEKRPGFKYSSRPVSASLPMGRCRGRKEQGFTLIEIVVAVIIMGLAYVVILQSFSMSARNIVKIEELRDNLLQYTLEFEQQSLDTRLNSEEGVSVSEDVFMAGSSYQLVLVSDESQTFMTLRLEKL